MIIDKLEHAQDYFALGKRFEAALRFLASEPMDSSEPVSLLDGSVKISVSDFISKPEPECNIEAHATVADIHYCIQGTEVIGYCERAQAVPKSGFDLAAETVYFQTGDLNYMKLLPGMFCILLPQDVHCAKIMNSAPEHCRKAVVKVSLL